MLQQRKVSQLFSSSAYDSPIDKQPNLPVKLELHRPKLLECDIYAQLRKTEFHLHHERAYAIYHSVCKTNVTHS